VFPEFSRPRELSCNVAMIELYLVCVHVPSLPLMHWPVYIRGCQEHFSPSAGGADLVRDIQPLSP
jgi:hypothetical protein